ncbi:unnamed protein product [Echinostoma caproni]|uniref:14_3_3 domain-containing protein n=1 Tax=Echinostoma caproni TaxID=27848 RepID=A0A183AX31_9TREM|nr:unnamed protein product [Echinostoma caproni]
MNNFIILAEIVELMKKVVEEDTELSVEERNLLSIAYNNVIGTRRTSWRVFGGLEGSGQIRANPKAAGPLKQYREELESEINKVSTEVLELLDKYLKAKYRGRFACFLLENVSDAIRL